MLECEVVGSGLCVDNDYGFAAEVHHNQDSSSCQIAFRVWGLRSFWGSRVSELKNIPGIFPSAVLLMEFDGIR
jgi:hypothetical protein